MSSVVGIMCCPCARAAVFPKCARAVGAPQSKHARHAKLACGARMKLKMRADAYASAHKRRLCL
eukprot:3903873-Prorocentrum_lima.AAC.1